MKLPNIDYLKETTPAVLSDERGVMIQEFNDTQKAHLIARSRLLILDKILDMILNKSEMTVIEDYPPEEIIKELDEAGYFHTEDKNLQGKKILKITLHDTTEEETTETTEKTD